MVDTFDTLMLAAEKLSPKGFKNNHVADEIAE